MDASQVQGVVLAGGTGSRLGKLTKTVNKHLLPMGDEPMIYHPIRRMVRAGIRNIVLVTGYEHVGGFAEALGDGDELGCDLTYRVQMKPGGIAQALGLCERLAGNRSVMVLLGDNYFEDDLYSFVFEARLWEPQVSLKQIPDPERFGCPRFENDNPSNSIVEILEKPKDPPSDYAVTGQYLYPPDVFEVVKRLKPSARGELEITDVSNHYLRQGTLRHTFLSGFWSDAGTSPTYAAVNKFLAERS